MKKKPYAKNNTPHGLHYKHDLGQHFLYDEDLIAHLVDSTGITIDDTVLEIGAGSGMLTAELCRKAKKVVAVEVDEQVLPFLKLKTSEFNNLKIVQGDIRKLDINSICSDLEKPFYVIANIPYNITTSIFELLFNCNLPIKQISVMIQKEVAEKLEAKPSTSQFSYLSLHCQYYSIPETICIVPASAFTPPPKVDSAFITLHMRDKPPMPVLNEKCLFRLMKASFQMRRKTLTNALKSVTEAPKLKIALEKCGLSPTIRGETLCIEQWITLANAYYEEII